MERDESPARPLIEYPCAWGYRVIGADEAALREVIGRILGTRPHRLETGNTSRGGRWCSLRLDLEVRSEEDRLELARQLVADPAVRLVL